MKRSWMLLFFFVLFGSLSVLSASDEPAAIVCFVAGKTTVKLPDGAEKEAGLFERLVPGTHIQTGNDGKLVLAFLNGKRFEIGRNGAALVARDGIQAPVQCQSLSPVPAMVNLPPITEEEKLGKRPTAVRIRTDVVSLGLYPSQGAAVAAGQCVLRFKGVEGMDRYKVELENQAGNTVFAVETPAVTVAVPAEILMPGATYYWRVKTLDPQKATVRDEALFVTLSKEAAIARQTLKEQAGKSKDVSLLLLMAETDNRLGLWREACDELKEALDQVSDKSSLQETVAQFGCVQN